MPYDRITPFNEAPTAAALWIATLEAGPDGPSVRDPITGAALSIRQAATCLVAPEARRRIATTKATGGAPCNNTISAGSGATRQVAA